MMNDDDLRSGLADLADQAEVTPVALEQVQARGRRRALYQRGATVLAAFALVVGGTVAITSLSGDGDGDDAATESESDTETDADRDTAENTDDDAGDEETGDGETSDDAAEEDAADDMAESVVAIEADGGYYGGEAPMAWGDGFLSVRQDFVPSETTLDELIPDLESRVPAEVAEAIEAAGVDISQPGAIDEAIAVLTEAGLFDQVSEIFLDDPELMEAYTTVMSGGTYVQVAEYSADGLTWEPIDFGLDLPENTWPEYRSNGDQLIAIVTENVWDENGQQTAFGVTVHATDDLATWTSVEIPFTLPSAADYVRVDGWVDQVAVGPDGWYVGMAVNEYIDLWSLLPDRVQNGSYSWTPAPEGIRIEDWESVYELEEDAAESGDYEALELAEPEVVEVIPWDQFPFTFEEWNAANYREGDRQAFIGTFDGSVAPAASPPGLEWFQLAGTADGFLAWGQVHTPSELTMQDLVPDIEERFPAEIVEALAAAGVTVGDVDSIDLGMQILSQAGLLDLATQTLEDDPALMDAFMQVSNGGTYETEAFFSADGSSWTPVAFPDVQWADSVAPVSGGILMVASSEAGGQEFWLGDAQGGSWEQVAGPELGENQWVYFDTRSSGGEGLAAVIDAGEPHGPMYLAWSATAEHDGYQITLSADGEGQQTLTIVDTTTGDVVRDVTIEIYSQELFVWGEETFDFLDDDGEVIVSLPADVGEELAWGAESAAWDEWYQANPYVPELTLIATVDGRDWVVQKIDVGVDGEGWYGGGAAINGGIVVYRDAAGWQRVVVG